MNEESSVVFSQGLTNNSYSNQTLPTDKDVFMELTAQLSQFNWKEGVVDRSKRLIYSSDFQDNLKGVLSLKAMLCIKREEIYEVAQEVIDSGVISRLVSFLDVVNKDIQWASAFCLTNVAAGVDAQTEIVVQAGAVDPLIRLLRDPDSQLRRQAIFCLANIAGSTPEHRMLLVRHPNYYQDMFAVASTSDPKLYELICWGIRNICYLGGPSFEEILPGIKFLVEKIFISYWSFPQYEQSIRFALETIASVCRTSQGRDAVQSRGFMLYLLSFLNSLEPNANLQIQQPALETLSWLLAYGEDYNKEMFIERDSLIDRFVKYGIQGRIGVNVQELCFKCFVSIAMDSKFDLFLNLTKKQGKLFNITGQIISEDIQQVYCNSSSLTTKSQASIRECAAFLFSKILLCSSFIPCIVMQILLSKDIVKLLMQVIEYCCEQLGLNTHYTQTVESNSNDSTNGPTFPSFTETVTQATLNAMIELLHQGEIVQHREEMAENPIVFLFLECDGKSRIENIIRSTILPSSSFQLANHLVEKLQSTQKHRPYGSEYFQWD